MPNSKNNRALKLCGLREVKGNPIDFPTELGYHCPVCRIEFDQGLQWSEYKDFLWCERCDYDFPSALCKKDPKEGTEVYLDIVEKYQFGAD